MTRLAVVIEELHATASDPATGEEAGRAAAGELGKTILRHIELITTALRTAGRK